jgi:Protein of unknown function (DUF2939)
MNAGLPELSGVVHLQSNDNVPQGSVFMRKMILGLFALVVGVAGYGLWPVISAFQIKQAVKSGDVATLERKVHWAPVRASLKASIALLTPPATDTSAQTSSAPSTSLWSRIKSTAAPMLAETFIEKYVTPEGISQIQQVRRGGWRTLFGMAPRTPEHSTNAAISAAIQGDDSPVHADGEPNVITKFINFYQRVISARFHSLSSVEFEIADKGTPGRRYISLFELSNFDWKLASVRVVGVGF